MIIGSDNAHLAPDHIETAFAALINEPVVLGPAEDGGYWLVGQRSPGVDLFSGVPWSSPKTLDVTLHRLKDLGVRWNGLDTLPDIDTVDDLRMAIRDPRVSETLRTRLASAFLDSKRVTT